VRAHPLPFVAVATVLLLTLAITGLAFGQADVSFADQGAGQAGPLAPAPASTTVTLYLDPMADAYVSQVAPTTNFGSATRLDVQNLDGGEFPDDRRSYVGFDLSSIPKNATITSAAFKAYLFEAQGLSSVSIQLRRVTSSWADNSVT